MALLNFQTYDTGFRTIKGEDINAMQTAINGLDAGTEPGSYTGTFNGIVGGTTPAAGTFTTLISTGGALNGTLGATTPAAASVTTLGASGALTFGAAASGVVLKQGANGKCGTTALTAGASTVSNSSIAITDTIILSLNAVGGTIASQPYVDTITAGVGFTVAGGGGSNTSTYNYVIISNAA